LCPQGQCANGCQRETTGDNGRRTGDGRETDGRRTRLKRSLGPEIAGIAVPDQKETLKKLKKILETISPNPSLNFFPVSRWLLLCIRGNCVRLPLSVSRCLPLSPVRSRSHIHPADTIVSEATKMTPGTPAPPLQCWRESWLFENLIQACARRETDAYMHPGETPTHLPVFCI